MRPTRIITYLLIFLATIFSMNTQAQTVTSELVKEIAPTGTLRVGINLGNPILAGWDESSQQPIGVSVDLARELTHRLNLPIQLTTFKTAGNTVEAIKKGELDLVFVAIDPLRGQEIAYSSAYVQIEGAYMVQNHSTIEKNEDVDKKDIRIVVGKGSAYDLFLTREIKHATLIRSQSSQSVLDDFIQERYEVAAGVKQQLEMDAQRYNNLRMLPGRFMVINQAMGIPHQRPNALTYIQNFIVNMKKSGFIEQALKRHHIEGAQVAQ